MASSPGALGSTVKQAEFKIGGKGTASVAEPFIFAGAGAGENRIKKILKRKDFNEFTCFYYYRYVILMSIFGFCPTPKRNVGSGSKILLTRIQKLS